MKKQILFVAMFTLAIIFAGTVRSYGQLAPGVTATTPITPLACVATSEPLHPFPGVPYKYSLDGDNGAEHAASYTWWATKDANFINAPVTVATMAGTNFAGRLAGPDVFGLSATYGTTTPAATVGSNEVEITWSADVLAGTKYQAVAGDAPKTSTFVVGYSEGENCADNIQVYEINPMPNFTIDIAAIDPADNTTTLAWDAVTGELCVDDVQSATYNTTSHELDMDYGTNTFYYEVAAANFVLDWTPTFQIISGLRTTQTAVISIHATKALATTGGAALWTSASLTVADLGTAIATATSLTATVPADAATGVSVFVKVVVDNNTEESLTDNPFVLAVDAQDNNETGIWDMEDADCAALADAPDQVDQATITVTPRPQLDHNTVDNSAQIPTTTIPKPSTSTGVY